MRIYIINYLVEYRDSCDDCEIEINAVNIYGALDNFRAKGIVHKRVTVISEKPNVIQNGNSESN